MPTIQILFDDEVVNEDEVLRLGEFLKELCLKSKNLDVKYAFAYAENPKIRTGLFPIETYLKITRSKIINEDALLKEIELGIKAWKVADNFKHPVNILLMPMDWKILDSL